MSAWTLLADMMDPAVQSGGNFLVFCFVASFIYGVIRILVEKDK
jgi:hypothetical protein